MKLVIAVLMFVSMAAASDAPSTKWTFERTQNPIDDKVRGVLSLPAESPIGERVPKLIIRCQRADSGRHYAGRDLEVYVVTNMPVHGGDTHKLRVRFDNEKPVEDTWNDSQELGAVFHFTMTPQGQLHFVQKMAAAHKLLFEFTPYLGTPQVAEFDLTGLSLFMPQLYDACNWPK